MSKQAAPTAARVMRSGTLATRLTRPATSLAVRPTDTKPAPQLSRPGTSASNVRPPITRAASRVQLRSTSTTKNKIARSGHDDGDVLKLQIDDDFEAESDFRFDV